MKSFLKIDLKRDKSDIMGITDCLAEFKVKLLDTSSKKNQNVREAFEDLVRDIFFDPAIEKFDTLTVQNPLKKETILNNFIFKGNLQIR